MNLLGGIVFPRIETVDNYTYFYKLKSPHKYYLQNIVWFGEKILNSCGEGLQLKVKEASENITDIRRGGPVYYLYLNQIIFLASDKLLCGLVENIWTLRLNHIDSEYVKNAGN